jgi:hypothetical protein
VDHQQSLVLLVGLVDWSCWLVLLVGWYLNERPESRLLHQLRIHSSGSGLVQAIVCVALDEILDLDIDSSITMLSTVPVVGTCMLGLPQPRRCYRSWPPSQEEIVEGASV